MNGTAKAIPKAGRVPAFKLPLAGHPASRLLNSGFSGSPEARAYSTFVHACVRTFRSLRVRLGPNPIGVVGEGWADLRLYRESPQGGLSSHWSVAVGPTAYQWCTFISSLSQTEEEADLGSFLKQELFV
ncbi:unnamed protein product, partial [Dibothriocephalus latus]